MSHLGSFGAAVKELDPDLDKDTFEFFDEKFSVVGVVPPMLHLQLGASLTGKIDEAEGLGAMWETLRTCLTVPERQEPDGHGGTRTVAADDSQFSRFYKTAVARRCDLEELMKLAMTLFEGQAGRPTEEPHGSSPGAPTISPNSNGSSSTPPALQGLTPVAHLVHGSPAYPGVSSAT